MVMWHFGVGGIGAPVAATGRTGLSGCLSPPKQQLWDLEQGGPTSFDESGYNYNPVVVDDSVTRQGYPALVGGWKGAGADLETMYPYSHPKG
mmetsp:Transcript_2441/g.5410  ORF Transcript_2441/g.5410 Transcript_2441/m.5410 type:complete len:92 (-) Transcript_2441:65-340(-)|eukprot:CAMPEP_0172004492 /NCGR_PEP_ID=MMETSP1041-20130122/4504_1 /TAXON_ID=464988 /ORGANISM="Hemiselmis andersenii, Strain CCMP439" /LENGTH=91 /DNA_ID=CAMNT_0012658347 /DNA_START=116 /DNA_END=388 /DNA_ORIENTATION=-